MRKLMVLLLAVFLLAGVLAAASDQTGTAGNAPKVIRILREEIKIGQMPAHDALARQVRQAAESLNANLYYVSGTTLAGSSSEFVSLAFFDSFADLAGNTATAAKVFQAAYKNADFARQSTETHQSGRVSIGRLRPELSYNLEKLDLANATGWEISTLRLKPGTEGELEEALKERIDLHKKGNIQEVWAMYEVVAGGFGPAFVEIRPRRSLAELDVDLGPAHKAAIPATINKRFQNAVRDAVLFEETIIVNARPEISRPPQSFLAANPGFWTVKEEAPVTAAKTAKQKGPVVPAAKKE